VCSDGLNFAAHNTYDGDGDGDGAMIDEGTDFAAGHLAACPNPDPVATVNGGFGH
jgi:hypothetical protein